MNKKLEEYSREELIEEIKALKRRKKFGLVWEDKKEDIVEKCKNEIPVLKEVPELAINEKPGEPTNLIIEGDNFASLQVLNYTHHGKIDVIYIDPPYNTGSQDFVYDDNYVDPEDDFRHSKWLSFMDKRLRLAKELLSENGMVFISIDDNELSALKMLCDDIFREKNFVANIVNQSANSVFGQKAANKERTYIKVKDYVLVYKNDKAVVKLSPLYCKSKNYLYDSHEFILDGGRRYSTVDWFKEKYSEIFKKYDKKINKENIQKIMQFDDAFRKKVMRELSDKQFSTSPYSKGDLSDEEKNSLSKGEIIKHGEVSLVQEGNGTGLIRFLRSLGESCHEVDGEYVKCDILGDLWNTSAGYGNINAEGGVKFASGKKPLLLLTNILESVNKKDAIVLDFFAGSGSTGHAVLDQNIKDGGTRRFILCTHGKEKDGADINIARGITYPRIRTVVTGIRPDGSKYSDGIPANVRYFTTDFIEKGVTNDVTRAKLFEKSDEMIQVRENAFEFVDKNDNYTFYKNNEKFVAIIKDPFNFGPIWYELEEKNTEKLPVKLYVFSYSNYTFEDEIPDTDLKYEICAIPNSIMEVYRKISDKKEER